MNLKDNKSLVTIVVGAVLAIGVSLGYVSESCVCTAPDVIPEPPVVVDEVTVEGDAGL
jgi:hypothetical protein